MRRLDPALIRYLDDPECRIDWVAEWIAAREAAVHLPERPDETDEDDERHYLEDVA